MARFTEMTRVSTDTWFTLHSWVSIFWRYTQRARVSKNLWYTQRAWVSKNMWYTQRAWVSKNLRFTGSDWVTQPCWYTSGYWIIRTGWFTFVFRVPVAIGCTKKLWISSLYRFITEELRGTWFPENQVPLVVRFAKFLWEYLILLAIKDQ